MANQVLLMIAPSEKLRDLEDFIPDPTGAIGHFGRFVADYFGAQKISPQDFVIGCELSIYDLQEGVDPDDGEPIENELVGQPSEVYDLLSESISRIAEVVFPGEFARRVRGFIKEIDGKASN